MDQAIEPSQVAEIFGHSPTGGALRGSGYRVSEHSVLTAAHVVNPLQHIRVRFNADQSDEWEVDASISFQDSAFDIAVLTLASRRLHPLRRLARYGQVGERAAVIPVRAVGFPYFKVKSYGQYPDAVHHGVYRDMDQADGSIAVFSNRRE